MSLAVALRYALRGLAAVTAGPEAEVISLLKAAEKELPPVSVPAGQLLQPHAMQYGRLNVQAEGALATVVSTLDLDGKVGDTHVSSLGWEKVGFDRHAGVWAPSAGWAPRLAAALAVLEKRRVAIEQGQEAVLRSLQMPGQALGDLGTVWTQWAQLKKRRYRVEGWYLRSEPDRVAVTEEWHLEGDSLERPFDQKGRTSLSLVEVNGGFFFENGVL
ncbi:MAG: hypothetical protein K1X64_11680 [Myxococcaceae bacterium]|nr:hypothetical protein [Myxococcaceae bacterium]